MKTQERSPKRLRLVQIDWHIGALVGVICICGSLMPWLIDMTLETRLFLVICGIALLAMGLMKTRRVTVILDKQVGTVQMRIDTALGAQINAAPLKVLRRSQMQTTHLDENGRGELLLLFNDRDEWAVRNISCTRGTTPPPPKQINDWMHLHLPLPEEAYENHP